MYNVDSRIQFICFALISVVKCIQSNSMLLPFETSKRREKKWMIVLQIERTMENNIFINNSIVPLHWQEQIFFIRIVMTN